MILERANLIHVCKRMISLKLEYKNISFRHDGTCVEINETISGDKTRFKCICLEGYFGTNCQVIEDLCVDIKCENKAVCKSALGTWKCKCLDESLYYGTYCEHASDTLVAKQILSKSFATVAIAAIAAVYSFVLIMDILKYIFGVDPVDRERHFMKLEERKEHVKNMKKKQLEKFSLSLYRLN